MTEQENAILNSLIRGEYESLPSFCREWRKGKGYTQEYVGVKGGVSRSAICRFENGELFSNKALSGYVSLGMPIPYDLTLKYLKGSD